MLSPDASKRPSAVDLTKVCLLSDFYFKEKSEFFKFLFNLFSKEIEDWFYSEKKISK
jgi:hypothetical protein